MKLNMLKQFTLLFLLLFNVNPGFSQNLVLVDNKNEVFPFEYNYLVTLTIDKKTSISLKSKNSVFTIPDMNCDTLVEITIEGPFVQTYYNQYYCHQLVFLDTIQLGDRRMIKGQTPRLYLGDGFENDSIFTNQLWLKDWLKEYDDVANGISFMVNNAEKLTSKEKRLIRKSIAEYCLLIDKEEFKDLIEFKNECYTAGQEDLFNEGTKVTRDFIDNQNTNEMKEKAEKYSIVVSVLIDWKKH